jgi:hypothetical protein
MNCISSTGKRTCSLYGDCRYPATHAKFFAPEEHPCSQGDQCEVEITVGEPSIILTCFWASLVEKNTVRGLPWNCGCKLCTSGNWLTCYGKTGPDSELRSLIKTSGYTPPWQTTAPKQTAEAEEAQAP